MSQICLRLPDELLERLDAEAGRRDVTRSVVVRDLLEAALDAVADDRAATPWDRVGEIVGRYRLGEDDLGSRHREHLAQRIRDRRE